MERSAMERAVTVGTKRWQDWLLVAFGAWLVISPFILAYNSTTDVAAWNSYILGVAVAAFAIGALAVPRIWEEWVNLVLGIWLIVSPYLLQYSDVDPVATRNHLIVGFLIAASAIWAMVQYPAHRHPRTV